MKPKQRNRWAIAFGPSRTRMAIGAVANFVSLCCVIAYAPASLKAEREDWEAHYRAGLPWTVWSDWEEGT